MKTEDITLEAHPAMAGWSIVAKYNGAYYMVAVGLVTPDAKLRYWQKRIHVIADAIARKLATP